VPSWISFVVSEPLRMSSPVSDSFLTLAPVIMTAANAVPVVATNSATNATTIAGLGVRIFIVSSFRRRGDPLPRKPAKGRFLTAGERSR